MITERSRFFKDTKPVAFATAVAEIFKSISGEKMVFVSHKHNETEYVYRLFDLLKQYGFTGYVDWEDDEMPKTTSGETAVKLKEKIIKSYKFILIATNAAIESKWCNWEIGFGDAHKYDDHIALFPIKYDNVSSEGEEYLSIYQTLQSGNPDDFNNGGYYIQYPDGKQISLNKWLTL